MGCQCASTAVTSRYSSDMQAEQLANKGLKKSSRRKDRTLTLLLCLPLSCCSPRLNSRPVSALSGVSKGVKMPCNSKGLYTQGLREVLQLCNAADRCAQGE